MHFFQKQISFWSWKDFSASNLTNAVYKVSTKIYAKKFTRKFCIL